MTFKNLETEANGNSLYHLVNATQTKERGNDWKKGEGIRNNINCRLL